MYDERLHAEFLYPHACLHLTFTLRDVSFAYTAFWFMFALIDFSAVEVWDIASFSYYNLKFSQHILRGRGRTWRRHLKGCKGEHFWVK